MRLPACTFIVARKEEAGGKPAPQVRLDNSTATDYSPSVVLVGLGRNTQAARGKDFDIGSRPS